MQHEHDDGMHGVPQQRRVGLAAQHHGDDQPDLDHRHGERQHQRPEGLAHPECHHFGMVHGGRPRCRAATRPAPCARAPTPTLPTSSHAAMPSTGRMMRVRGNAIEWERRPCAQSSAVSRF